MKKIFVTVLAFAMAVSTLTACARSGDKASASPSPSGEVHALGETTPVPSMEVESSPVAQPVTAVPKSEVSAAPTAKATAKPAAQSTAKPAAKASAAPTTQATPAPQANLKETAQKYVGSSVGALYAAIGSPKSSDYAPSCLGDGEDGQLYYTGFTVATYREGGSETVNAVY